MSVPCTPTLSSSVHPFVVVVVIAFLVLLYMPAVASMRVVGVVVVVRCDEISLVTSVKKKNANTLSGCVVGMEERRS